MSSDQKSSKLIRIQELTSQQMDAVIVFGTIPTLWPLKKVFTGKFSRGSGNQGAYDNATSLQDHPYGTEAYELLDQRRPRKAGPATRALEEVDAMRTRATITAQE